MARDPRMYLHDMLGAARMILLACEDKTEESFRNDLMGRAGVLWHFTVIGEAMNKLQRTFPDVAATVGDEKFCRGIVAFRNRIVHGYFDVDYRDVWIVITDHLPRFMISVREALATADKNTDEGRS